MQFNFKGKTYRMDESYWKGDMPNTSPEFQYEQLIYCIQIGDFQTLENRITNMLKWGGLLDITNKNKENE
jgi:hypothetical protein